MPKEQNCWVGVEEKLNELEQREEESYAKEDQGEPTDEDFKTHVARG